ncbi:uncharacterized protein EHS24_006403 [Apiotrichum porosum]|uniref:Uncharacterized protein n=1 Tax=Apiotrichum porosum TaxID=105984 RepID=A0A427Y1F5_9TREE|nr:uncharacterized protein EHS24_006403 [Apiotrichum porosum]RSH84870.1 hypothetical protein EHS24_006403 [Apiotrichum porosum]
MFMHPLGGRDQTPENEGDEDYVLSDTEMASVSSGDEGSLSAIDTEDSEGDEDESEESDSEESKSKKGAKKNGNKNKNNKLNKKATSSQGQKKARKYGSGAHKCKVKGCSRSFPSAAKPMRQAT